jgi:hypothetical protein
LGDLDSAVQLTRSETIDYDAPWFVAASVLERARPGNKNGLPLPEREALAYAKVTALASWKKLFGESESLKFEDSVLGSAVQVPLNPVSLFGVDIELD